MASSTIYVVGQFQCVSGYILDGLDVISTVPDLQVLAFNYGGAWGISEQRYKLSRRDWLPERKIDCDNQIIADLDLSSRWYCKHISKR